MKAVINEAFAKTYFPRQSPLGRVFRAGAAGPMATRDIEVVGVARDSRYDSIRSSAPPTFFTSYLQSAGDGGNMAFEVRTSGDPGSIAAAVRRTVGELDPAVPVSELSTEEQTINQLLRQDRLFAALSSIFGVLALVLASIGLYGVRAHAVARRTSEIGIRMALGATKTAIMQLVARETAWIAGIGTAVGLFGAFVTARAIRGMLFGLAPNDPATFAMAAAVLIFIAVIAGYLPARRAAQVDPLNALRHE